ncbi:hypothetical protein TWF694_000546 [Orbilia ellipsospora]|uniref:Uncharacterized protein n=1 Tax=Orbilia ellipsospora TaxID=2528407 RepID=A0AAV9XQN5_9PEZI
MGSSSLARAHKYFVFAASKRHQLRDINLKASSTMASLKDRSRKAKTIFTLDTPTSTYLHPPWPSITPQTATSLLIALTTLLTDLRALQDASDDKKDDDSQPYILFGTNPITSHLESLASSSLPPALSSLNPTKTRKTPRKPLVIFVNRSDQPSQLHSHIPTLCSLSHTPLIALPKLSEQKLVKILKPASGRIHCLTVFHDTPGIESLKSIIYNDDGEIIEGKVELPGMFESAEIGWLETKSKAVQTFIGEPKKQKRKDSEGEGGDVSMIDNEKTPKKRAKKNSG